MSELQYFTLLVSQARKGVAPRDYVRTTCSIDLHSTMADKSKIRRLHVGEADALVEELQNSTSDMCLPD